MFRSIEVDDPGSGATVHHPWLGRPAFLDGRLRASVERSPRLALAALLATTLGAIGAVSTLQRWILSRPAAGVLAVATARDLIAAALWIPLGWLAVALARRIPLRRGSPLAGILIHLVAGAGAGIALNCVWTVLIALAGLWPDPSTGIVRMAVRTSVGFLHINVVIWLLIAATTSAWAAHAETEPEPEPAEGKDRIAVRTNGRTTVLDVARIDWVEAAGDYARLHVAGRSYLLAERMHVLETRLGGRFMRVHRSAIVNLDRVREVLPRPAGDATLVLRDETVVPLSRRRRAAVLERLGR